MSFALQGECCITAVNVFPQTCSRGQILYFKINLGALKLTGPDNLSTGTQAIWSHWKENVVNFRKAQIISPFCQKKAGGSEKLSNLPVRISLR